MTQRLFNSVHVEKEHVDDTEFSRKAHRIIQRSILKGQDSIVTNLAMYAVMNIVKLVNRRTSSTRLQI